MPAGSPPHHLSVKSFYGLSQTGNPTQSLTGTKNHLSMPVFISRDPQWQKCEQRRGKVSPFKGGINKAVECLMVMTPAMAEFSTTQRTEQTPAFLQARRDIVPFPPAPPGSLPLSPPATSFPAAFYGAERSWQEGSHQVGNTEPEAWVGAGSSAALAAASPAPAAFPALLFVCLFLWTSIPITFAP